MKKLLLLALVVAGCGRQISSDDSKVGRITFVGYERGYGFCKDYWRVDMTDAPLNYPLQTDQTSYDFVLQTPEQAKVAKEGLVSGQAVRIDYDKYDSNCTDGRIVKNIEIISEN